MLKLKGLAIKKKKNEKKSMNNLIDQDHCWNNFIYQQHHSA